MTSLVATVLLIAAIALLAPAAFFALEILGALLPQRRPARMAAGPIAVVIPAHDEAAIVGAAIAGVKAELRAGDRLIVVADNCTDATAEIARAAGAETLERKDPSRRGKGYALQHAIDALRDAELDVIVFIDADCRVEPGAVAEVASAAAGTRRPAQALYLMKAPEGAPPSRRVAEFAFTLMNRARMGGLFTLFDVCRLTGAGMALPFETAKTIDVASAEIVEDLALGLHLAEKGAPPVFCPSAVVTSDYPIADGAATKQRARWEHGSLRLAFRKGPKLLVRAAETRDLRLAAAALDLMIPPLSALFAALIALLVLTALMLPAGISAPFAIVRIALALVAGATFLGWLVFGREALPLQSLSALGSYLLGKAKVYGGKARASTRGWTRTGRDGAP